jgi:hypothetical protein
MGQINRSRAGRRRAVCPETEASRSKTRSGPEAVARWRAEPEVCVGQAPSAALDARLSSHHKYRDAHLVPVLDLVVVVVNELMRQKETSV